MDLCGIAGLISSSSFFSSSWGSGRGSGCSTSTFPARIEDDDDENALILRSMFVVLEGVALEFVDVRSNSSSLFRKLLMLLFLLLLLAVVKPPPLLVLF